MPKYVSKTSLSNNSKIIIFGTFNILFYNMYKLHNSHPVYFCILCIFYMFYYSFIYMFLVAAPWMLKLVANWPRAWKIVLAQQRFLQVRPARGAHPDVHVGQTRYYGGRLQKQQFCYKCNYVHTIKITKTCNGISALSHTKNK